MNIKKEHKVQKYIKVYSFAIHTQEMNGFNDVKIDNILPKIANTKC